MKNLIFAYIYENKLYGLCRADQHFVFAIHIDQPLSYVDMKF